MPRYKITQKCFIDNSLRNEGDIITYDGPPAPQVMDPLDPPPETATEVPVEAQAAPIPVAKPQARTPAQRVSWARKAKQTPPATEHTPQ
jgi:hypothetical protein